MTYNDLRPNTIADNRILQTAKKMIGAPAIMQEKTLAEIDTVRQELKYNLRMLTKAYQIINYNHKYHYDGGAEKMKAAYQQSKGKC